jgi:hypothetical protein
MRPVTALACIVTATVCLFSPRDLRGEEGASSNVPEQLPPFEIAIRVLPNKHDWQDAPVVVDGRQLDPDLDFRSIRVYRDQGRVAAPVPFRIHTDFHRAFLDADLPRVVVTRDRQSNR